MTEFMQALPLFKKYSEDEWDDYGGLNLQGLYLVDLLSDQNIAYKSDVDIALGKEWPVYSMSIERYGIEAPEAYGGRPNAIESITKNTLSVYPNPCAEFVAIQGLKPDQEVSLIATNGAILAKAQADAAGHAKFDTHTLASGVYFISTGKEMLQIVKK